ncbi:hypothetical protein O181_013829 [Austropuccinia psidii MF-1]|uniref:Uncharacterized protein n=1 Tax=Austropuccinia psidii MF-1 TaxID=1389203 RepID=A0A9Q3GP98_9BASI|nr:hypothetical protein [Austropuccinia psidii MF-1]
MPREQTPRQLTPGPKPSQHNEPSIPGPSHPSEPHEDALTWEPEPEVAPMQSMEEPFDRPATTAVVIIIDNTPVGSPSTPSTPTPVPSPDIPLSAPENPTAKLPSIPQ